MKSSPFLAELFRLVNCFNFPRHDEFAKVFVDKIWENDGSLEDISCTFMPLLQMRNVLLHALSPSSTFSTEIEVIEPTKSARPNGEEAKISRHADGGFHEMRLI